MKSEFAKRLAMLRRERKLNQRQAAVHFGISQALLSHYENGAREPRFDFVIQACEFYSVTADYLLGRTNERTTKTQELAVKVRENITSLAVLLKEEADLLGKLEEMIDDM